MSKPKTGHKSYESAFNGIALYQQKNYSDLITVRGVNQYSSALNKLLIKFLKETGLRCENDGSSKSVYKNANTTQDNWGEFKKWISNQ